MKAIQVKSPGGAQELFIGEYPQPQATGEYLLIRVEATALNRADIFQRMGAYPPPPGASEILGLELAGEVVAVGEAVKTRKVGDRVFGLVPGGSYAQYALIHEQMALPMPEGFSAEEAAAIPEVFLTAYQALVYLAKLKKGEKVLIHAGASGVGTAALQIAKALGAESLVTASASKHQLCTDLGAALCIDYRQQNFAEEVLKYTQKAGVSVIIDFIGASYWADNLKSLALEGRLVLLALLGGAQASDNNLGLILRKRLQIIGSTLRARSLEYQITLTQDMWNFARDKFDSGELKVIIDRVYDWQEVSKAHTYMESNQNKGKIILKIT